MEEETKVIAIEDAIAYLQMVANDAKELQDIGFDKSTVNDAIKRFYASKATVEYLFDVSASLRNWKVSIDKKGGAK